MPFKLEPDIPEEVKGKLRWAERNYQFHKEKADSLKAQMKQQESAGIFGVYPKYLPKQMKEEQDHARYFLEAKKSLMRQIEERMKNYFLIKENLFAAALIAACGTKTSTFLRLLKETAAMAGEIASLRLEDVDFLTGMVRIKPEKGSKPRIFKISSTALNMLAALKAKSASQRVFTLNLRALRRVFQRQRERLARKLQNHRLRLIHFHTFRHWKATMLYHQTKDILYVMNFLGHKSIKNPCSTYSSKERYSRKRARNTSTRLQEAWTNLKNS